MSEEPNFSDQELDPTSEQTDDDNAREIGEIAIGGVEEHSGNTDLGVGELFPEGSAIQATIDGGGSLGERLRYGGGVLAVGLAAGSLFLAGCDAKGGDHPLSQDVLVSCDIAEPGVVPGIKVTTDQPTSAFGDNGERLDVHDFPIHAIDISCVTGSAGRTTSATVPGLTIVYPDDPQANTLVFNRLQESDINKIRIQSPDSVKHVDFVIRVNGTAANGFDLQVKTPESQEDLEREQANGTRRIVVPEESSGEISSGPVKVTSVELMQGPGSGFVG